MCKENLQKGMVGLCAKDAAGYNQERYHWVQYSQFCSILEDKMKNKQSNVYIIVKRLRICVCLLIVDRYQIRWNSGEAQTGFAGGEKISADWI